MRINCMVFFLALMTTTLAAQDSKQGKYLPITLTLFTESASLPDFHNTFSPANWGIRIGTELPWKTGKNGHLIQTLNVAYYRHKGLQQGVYFSTELGYRRFFGNWFADVTLGGGYLRLSSDLPHYESTDAGYQKTKAAIGRFMPTLGLGFGYHFSKFALFTRYEVFGEMPLNYRAAPILPHSALHIGARFQPYGK